MNINGNPFGSTVTPLTTTVTSAVGLETVAAKTDAIPPIEATSASTGALNRRNPNVPTAAVNVQLSLQSPSAEQQLGLQSPPPLPLLSPSAEQQLGLQSPSAEEQLGLQTGEQAGKGAVSGQNTESVNTNGSQDRQKRVQAFNQQRQQEVDQETIRKLAARDREVRNHERAHSAIGGQFAGAASYTFKRGPDGVSYAVGGEVPISVGAVAGNPEATIRKAQQVQRAALAPADPSSADRQIAARAAQIAVQARSDVQQLNSAERAEQAEKAAERRAENTEESETTQESSSTEFAPVSTIVEQSATGATEREEREDDEEREPVEPPPQPNFDISQKLIKIGLGNNNVDIGSILSEVI